MGTALELPCEVDEGEAGDVELAVEAAPAEVIEVEDEVVDAEDEEEDDEEVGVALGLGYVPGWPMMVRV